MNIKTIEDLGAQFAKTCGGKYTTNFSIITKTMQEIKKDSIIVVYSAGDIDYQLRKFLGK